MTDVDPRYPPPKHQSEWLRRPQAADFLSSLGCPTSVRKLVRLASEGGGPAYNRVHDHNVVYSRTDLRDWARKNTKRIET